MWQRGLKGADLFLFFFFLDFFSFFFLFHSFSLYPAETASIPWRGIWFWAEGRCNACSVLCPAQQQAGGKQGWEQTLNVWDALISHRGVGMQLVRQVVFLVLRMILKLCASPFLVPTFGISFIFVLFPFTSCWILVWISRSAHPEMLWEMQQGWHVSSDLFLACCSAQLPYLV